MNFNTYIGVVSAVDENDPEHIDISSLELSPYLSGELQPGSKRINLSIMDALNNEVEEIEPVDTKVTIKAKYIGETYKGNPPFVKKGETVFVHQIGKAGQFFWESIGRHDHLRTTDTYSIFVSAKPIRDTEPLTDKNAYVFAIDPRTKQCRLSTSKANDEEASYAVTLDGGVGTFSIDDDHGNQFEIKSNDHIILMKNEEGSSIALDKGRIVIYAPEEVVIGGKSFTSECSLLKLLGTSGTGATELVTSGLTIKSGHVTIDSSKIGLNGQVTIADNLIVNGPVQATGFSTGSGVPGYANVTVNHVKRTGSISSAGPNGLADTSGNRHATAYEQFEEIVTKLATGITKLDAIVGAGATADANAAVGIVPSSIMTKNQGE